MPSKAESIWTRPFALLCFAEFLGYAQHAVLQPTFPLYIAHLGGSPFTVGLVIACFGVTSVVSRPILG
ncbi:MAG TPA: MFS transporter, partial [Candidatus Binatia bacterium]